MRHPLPHRLLCVSAAVAASLVLAACGGGNGNPPPQTSTPTNPTGAPEVTITRSAADTVATGPVVFTFSFNRDVGTTFTADDITVTGGTKGTFTRVSGTSATIEVVPTPDSAGNMTVSLAAGAVSDATGNGNAAVSATQAYNTVVQTVLVSFGESPAPTLTGFGGAEDATIVNDPAGGTNKVARIVKNATAEVWAGTTVSICPSQAIVALPFATGRTTLTAKVWSPAAGVPVRMKVENAADGTKSVETEATTTVANAWETLSFNFANAAAGTAALNLANTYNKASVFFNFGTGGAATGARTYFLDDIAFRGSNFTVACPSTTPTTAITMDEATPPTLTGFGGAEDATIVNDPAGGTNKVARVVKSATAELWAGTTVSNLPSQAVARIGFTDSAKTITVRVYSPTVNTPVRLKVENAADGTQSVETEARTTVANAWETLTFNFANPAAGTAALNLANTYNKVSIFFNFGTTGAAAGGARTYFFEDIRYPSASTAPSTSTITFDTTTAPTLTGFGGAEDATVVTDPTNAGNKVMRVVKSATAELWAGTTVSTGANNSIPRIGFSASATTITARVWSPVAGIPVRMKVEDAADGNKSVETEATVTTASGWQTLSFNFANAAAGTAALNLATSYTKLSVFFDFGKTGGQAGGARTYFLDDIVIPVASTGGGTPATPLTFASGYRQGGTTAQGGTWGYFSGDFGSYLNTFTGGGFADSSPAVADNDQYFYIAVTTSAPTAQTGNPPNSGGFLGMYVTHPGLALTGQTTLKVNLGMDANFFRQASNKNIDVFVVGAQTFSNGAGGNCNVTLKGTVTPTTDAMITYSLTLANMTLVQPCNGGGFSSGVSTVAQALAQPIGAVNTQFTFPNVNTTINSGTAGAPVYATGLTRGRTVFE